MRACHQDVVGLDVAVDHVHGVHVVHCRANVAEYDGDLQIECNDF